MPRDGRILVDPSFSSSSASENCSRSVPTEGASNKKTAGVLSSGTNGQRSTTQVVCSTKVPLYYWGQRDPSGIRKECDAGICLPGSKSYGRHTGNRSKSP